MASDGAGAPTAATPARPDTDDARAPYAHGHSEPVLRVHRWRTAENSAAYLLPYLGPGDALLDVGCGPGAITVDLAAIVAPGRVVGIDASAEVLEQARVAAQDARVDVELEVGDVLALAIPDDAFDVVHAHQVLQHLSDPVGALVQMRRVCRPGGLVAVREVDFRTAAAHPDMTPEWLDVYFAVAEHDGVDPSAGRHLLTWARQAGFTETTASASAWCFATPEDREWWGGSWAERVVSSAYALRAVELGLSTSERNEAVADRWRQWASDPDGWMSITSGELLARA